MLIYRTVVNMFSLVSSISRSWLIASSFLLVPMLTVWNVLPLLYYDLMNRILRFWCRCLSRRIRNERRARQFSLRFYYEQFLRIASIQVAHIQPLYRM